MVHMDIEAQVFIFTSPIVRSSSLKLTKINLRGRSGVWWRPQNEHSLEIEDPLGTFIASLD